jgi:hypothetical protein
MPKKLDSEQRPELGPSNSEATPLKKPRARKAEGSVKKAPETAPLSARSSKPAMTAGSTKSPARKAPPATAEGSASKPASATAVAERRPHAEPFDESRHYEEIAQLAYHLWEDRGCPVGSPERDWYDAVVKVRQKHLTTSN